MIPIVLPYLQAAMGLTWFVVLCVLAPCIPRLVAGRGSEQDFRTFPIFLTAGAMCAGAARFFIFTPLLPPMDTIELWFWAASWVVSIGAALSLLVVRHVLNVR